MSSLSHVKASLIDVYFKIKTKCQIKLHVNSKFLNFLISNFREKLKKHLTYM